MTPESGARVRYERRDINARALVFIALGACGASLLVLLGIGGLYRRYRSQEDAADSQLAPWSSKTQKCPPPPRLEVDLSSSLRELRESQQKRLTSYGWIDRTSGIVHVPVDRAIDRIVEHGVPEWQGSQKADSKLDKERNP